jgi:hypothetical protein
MTLELNPIRMRPGKDGRLTPVACDFKCGFDRDDPRWQRWAAGPSVRRRHLGLRARGQSARTHQGQSDVFVINDSTILAPTFGGGANSLVTRLGEAAIISSDFGNPPYESQDVARICYKHWLKQANAVIGNRLRRFAPWAMRCASISAPMERPRFTSW